MTLKVTLMNELQFTPILQTLILLSPNQRQLLHKALAQSKTSTDDVLTT